MPTRNSSFCILFPVSFLLATTLASSPILAGPISTDDPGMDNPLNASRMMGATVQTQKIGTVEGGGKISGTQNVDATGNTNTQIGSAMMGATVQMQEIGTVK